MLKDSLASNSIIRMIFSYWLLWNEILLKKLIKNAQLRLISIYNSRKEIEKICRDIQNLCTTLNKKQNDRINEKHLQYFSSFYPVLIYEKKKH